MYFSQWGFKWSKILNNYPVLFIVGCRNLKKYIKNIPCPYKIKYGRLMCVNRNEHPNIKFPSQMPLLYSEYLIQDINYWKHDN